MTALREHLPILLVILPLLGAIITALLRRGTVAWGIALAFDLVLPAIALSLLLDVMAAGKPVSYHIGGWPPPWGIEYRIDALNAFVLLTITIVGAVTVPYARRSVARELESHQHAWFYTMYLLCLAGLLGIVATGDAFNAFVFLEISSLATYVLIALGRNRRALVASYQYLIMGTIGATFYVIGVGLLYLVTGTLNLVDIADRLGSLADGQWRPVMAALAFLTVGICLKLALFPLHGWLPDAYTCAPSFVTAFLAGTATKAAVYLLIRIFYSVFGSAIAFDRLPVTEVLVVLSIAAMFLASFTAVFEANAKRMLAYSSVAQIGYITLGIALANQAGLTGGIVHLFNHALMKTALFLALGAVLFRTGSVQISHLAGIGRKMPLTLAAFVVAALGLIGVPGTSGFISKWYLALGSIDHGWWPIAFLIVASSLISVVYMGRIIEVAYFREPGPEVAEARDPPLSMLVPILVLAAATIYFGIDVRLTSDVAAAVASSLLGGLK
ncbi:MAG: monovalent cation/H+ antiporter subunit D family protein [Pseudomonadota bacterium]